MESKSFQIPSPCPTLLQQQEGLSSAIGYAWLVRCQVRRKDTHSKTWISNVSVQPANDFIVPPTVPMVTSQTWVMGLSIEFTKLLSLLQIPPFPLNRIPLCSPYYGYWNIPFPPQPIKYKCFKGRDHIIFIPQFSPLLSKMPYVVIVLNDVIIYTSASVSPLLRQEGFSIIITDVQEHPYYYV